MLVDYNIRDGSRVVIVMENGITSKSKLYSDIQNLLGIKFSAQRIYDVNHEGIDMENKPFN
jgi:hypothetical protein